MGLSSRNDQYVWGTILTKPKSTYHFLHLNSDELVDAIYSGPSVNEGNSFTLFINNGDSLTKFIGRQGTLVSINQTYPNSLIELTAVRYGCCDEPSNELYQAHYDPSKQNFIDSEGSYFIDDTEFPAQFEFRKLFRVTNESYHLRGTPEILNGEPEDYFFEKGNILATYNAGDTGVALTQKEDETGRIWWFVLMNPKQRYEYHIDEHFSKNNSWFGWMSSRFVEVIE